MADVWVKAKVRLQKPDRTWAREGDVFAIQKKLVSARTMTEATEDEIAAAKTSDSDKPVDKRDARIAALEAELADATAGRALMQEAADLLQVEQGDLIATISRLKEAVAKPSALGKKKGAA